MKELLKEIRDDLKDQPSREEYSALAERIGKLEDSYRSLVWKVASASAVLGLIVTIVLKFVLK